MKIRAPEGDTMLPIIDSFRLKYSFETLTIVADSGLISERNIQDLEERGYKYILGARIKNQPRSIEEQIHALDLRDGECQIIWKDPGTALVISFSARRARKDYFNRERGLKRFVYKEELKRIYAFRLPHTRFIKNLNDNFIVRMQALVLKRP
jgi:hypothetical protein